MARTTRPGWSKKAREAALAAIREDAEASESLFAQADEEDVRLADPDPSLWGGLTEEVVGA